MPAGISLGQGAGNLPNCLIIKPLAPVPTVFRADAAAVKAFIYFAPQGMGFALQTPRNGFPILIHKYAAEKFIVSGCFRHCCVRLT